MRAPILLGALLLLAACHREPPAAEAPAPAAAVPAAAVEVPPIQPRPDNLGPSVKWPAESLRFQQIRRQAYAEGLHPERLPEAREVAGRQGRFRVRLLDVPAHRVLRDERWHIRVLDSRGRPVRVGTLHVGGGMPEHGHGLPTRPAVHPGAAPGDYLIDGLQFAMPGWWEVSFYIAEGGRDDSVTFNVMAD